MDGGHCASIPNSQGLQRQHITHHVQDQSLQNALTFHDERKRVVAVIAETESMALVLRLETYV